MISQYASYETRRTVKLHVDALEKCKDTAFDSIKSKNAYEKRLADEKKRLDSMTPPDLASDQVPRVRKRIAQLEEAFVKGVNGRCPPSPSRRQMEQAPTGAVGQYNTHERFWKDNNLDPNGAVVKIDRTTAKGLIWELKDLKRIAGKEREYDDPDVANLSALRPDTDVSLSDSRLPRSYGLSPAARENFDQVFPDREPTPVERKIETERAKPEAKPRKEVPEERQCSAIKKNGAKCGVWTKEGSTFCGFHQTKKPPARAPAGGEVTE